MKHCANCMCLVVIADGATVRYEVHGCEHAHLHQPNPREGEPRLHFSIGNQPGHGEFWLSGTATEKDPVT